MGDDAVDGDRSESEPEFEAREDVVEDAEAVFGKISGAL